MPERETLRLVQPHDQAETMREDAAGILRDAALALARRVGSQAAIAWLWLLASTGRSGKASITAAQLAAAVSANSGRQVRERTAARWLKSLLEVGAVEGQSCPGRKGGWDLRPLQPAELERHLVGETEPQLAPPPGEELPLWPGEENQTRSEHSVSVCLGGKGGDHDHDQGNLQEHDHDHEGGRNQTRSEHSVSDLPAETDPDLKALIELVDLRRAEQGTPPATKHAADSLGKTPALQAAADPEVVRQRMQTLAAEIAQNLIGRIPDLLPAFAHDVAQAIADGHLKRKEVGEAARRSRDATNSAAYFRTCINDLCRRHGIPNFGPRKSTRPREPP